MRERRGCTIERERKMEKQGHSTKEKTEGRKGEERKGILKKEGMTVRETEQE